MTSPVISELFLFGLEDILVRFMTKRAIKRPFGKSSIVENCAFYSQGVTRISLQSYVERVLKFIELTDSHFILALKYFERVMQKRKYKTSRISLHKLFFACILASQKFLEDDIYDNSYYAQVAGMKPNDLFELEVEFYKAIDFDLCLDEQEFEAFKKEISGMTKGKEERRAVVKMEIEPASEQKADFEGPKENCSIAL